MTDETAKHEVASTGHGGLRVTRDAGVVLLTIDRAHARNAIDRALSVALREQLEQLSADPTARAVVLAAAGEVFVAGGDLTEFAALSMDDAGAQQVADLGAALSVIEHSPLPVIAALSGDVLGGGCELLVMCDLVVMEAHARIRWLHARMGLTPAWGGTTRLIERVGALRAAELLLTARAVEADEAHDMGLVNEVVARGESGRRAQELARSIAQQPREAIAAIKRSLGAAQRARRGDAFSRESQVFRDTWGSAAHREALSAFTDNRRNRNA